LPGFAVAGEADSEGEGTAPPIEVPVGPPDFDPGGEETGLEEEAPASEGEEESSAVVEPEVEVEVETSTPESVAGAGAEKELPAEAQSPPVLGATDPPAEAQPSPTDQPESPVAEPPGTVANQPITASQQMRVNPDHGTATAPASTASEEAAEPSEAPVEEHATTPSPLPVAATPPNAGGSLVGRNTYVVQAGDCLWHIAARLLPAGASTEDIAGEVAKLWRLNAARIGTGDPNLIYAGIELRLN